MPKLPPKPCTKPGCREFSTKKGRCKDHQFNGGWKNEKTRYQRGYDNEWFRTRHRVLSRDEWKCQCCLRMGIYAPANEVDHIVNKANGGDDDYSNLEAICKDCHKAKTKKESYLSIKYIRRPMIPVCIVCGPPGSGKSTYVTNHMVKGDTLICMDKIMQDISGDTRLTIDTEKHYKAALVERNRQLDQLNNKTQGKAYFITTGALRTDRERWKKILHTEELIMLDEDPSTCIDRINSDNTRGAKDKAKAVQGVFYFYDRYCR